MGTGIPRAIRNASYRVLTDFKTSIWITFRFPGTPLWPAPVQYGAIYIWIAYLPPGAIPVGGTGRFPPPIRGRIGRSAGQPYPYPSPPRGRLE